MHALTHSLSHRGPSASRARARWQPYSSIPTPSARSPSSAYINTPSTTVSTPSTSTQPALCDPDRPKPTFLPHIHAHVHKDVGVREAQKARYVNGLVDLAVSALCDIWHPHDVPAVFATPARLPASSPAVPVLAAPVPSSYSLLSYTQLPSPISPNHPSPSPMPPTHDQAASPPPSNACRTDMVPLKSFVQEMLRRSRTSCSTLQTALCYLEAIRSKVPELLRQECAGQGVKGESDQSYRIISADDPAASEPVPELDIDDLLDPTRFLNPESFCSTVDLPTVRVFDNNPLATPCVPSWQNSSVQPLARHREPTTALPPLPPLPSPLLCPRRTFLAALILASKFLQDKCYSNRAWAKLAGLPPREIGRCERALGEALQWRLWVGKMPAQRPSLSRSYSETHVPSGSATPFMDSSVCHMPMPPPRSTIRRRATVPEQVLATPMLRHSRLPAPAPPPLVPMPFVPADEGLASFLLPPAVATAPSTPMPMWPSYAPSVAGMSASPATYSSCSPTPTLTISPSTTDASADSIFDERTIQMPTIVDAPSPMRMKIDAAYAYAGELPSSVGGFLCEGGISVAWDGLWTTNGSNVLGAAHDPTSDFARLGSGSSRVVL